MSLNFPNTPAPGDVFTAQGRTFVWTGVVWTMQGLQFPWATSAEAAAGVAPDRVLSPFVAHGVVEAVPEPVAPFQGIPTVMGAARAVNIDYQNTLGRDMMVIIALNGNGGANLLIGQGGPGNARLAAQAITLAGQLSVLTGVISPGLFYRMELASGTITQWVEYR